MTVADLYAGTRALIGNPKLTEVPNHDLEQYLLSSLDWMAAEFEFDVRTETGIGLTAGEREIVLPQSMAWLYWIEWNGGRLDPLSTWAYDRDSGSSWNTLDTSATLSEYAVQGRRLVMIPGPTADAITTDPYLTWRYLAAPEGVTAGEMAKLSEMDQDLLRYDAAVNWLTAHPDPEGLNDKRVQGYVAQINRRLPAAKRRWENPIEAYAGGFVPEIYRSGAGRLRVSIKRPINTRIPYNTVKEELDCGPI